MMMMMITLTEVICSPYWTEVLYVYAAVYSTTVEITNLRFRCSPSLVTLLFSGRETRVVESCGAVGVQMYNTAHTSMIHGTSPPPLCFLIYTGCHNYTLQRFLRTLGSD